MTPMFMFIGLVTWFIVLLWLWHDCEGENHLVDDVGGVVLVGGILGGILAVIWPLTWTAVVVILLSRGIYKVYQVIANEFDEYRIERERRGERPQPSER